MKVLSCSKAEEWMVAHLDEGLPSWKQERLWHHVRGCPACRQHYRQINDIMDAVRQDVPPEPGEEFWIRFHTSLNVCVQEEVPPRRQLPWRNAGAIAATAVLILIVILSDFVPQSPEYPIRPPSSREVLMGLYQVYSPLSLDTSFTGWADDDVGNTEHVRFPPDDTELQMWEIEDDPVQLFL